MLSFGLLFFSLVEIMVPRTLQAEAGGAQSLAGDGDARSEP